MTYGSDETLMPPTPTQLPRAVRFRAWGLLDMLYSVTELAEELGISRDLVYKDLIPAGLPHTRDDTGRIWIHGPAAATWILDQKRKVKRSLRAGEFLCLHCRQAVSPDPASLTNATSGRFTYVKAVCPICGTTVCKGAMA